MQEYITHAHEMCELIDSKTLEILYLFNVLFIFNSNLLKNSMY